MVQLKTVGYWTDEVLVGDSVRSCSNALVVNDGSVTAAVSTVLDDPTRRAFEEVALNAACKSAVYRR